MGQLIELQIIGTTDCIPKFWPQKSSAQVKYFDCMIKVELHRRRERKCDGKFVHLISLVLFIVFDYCTHQSRIARSRHFIDI